MKLPCLSFDREKSVITYTSSKGEKLLLLGFEEVKNIRLYKNKEVIETKFSDGIGNRYINIVINKWINNCIFALLINVPYV